MVKKYGLWYTIKYYHLIPIILYGLLLTFLHDTLCIFLNRLIPGVEGSRTYNIHQYLINILLPILLTIVLFIIWLITALFIYRIKHYKYVTKRNLLKDYAKYKRTYKDLCEFYIDADPLKLDEDTLPAMRWQESSGLIFGKIGEKLISFNPEKNGIVSMIWGAPGDGKTTSNIIPSCRQFGMKKNSLGVLEQKGSVMVTDIKGDIYEANKNCRKIKRFSTIHWKESAHYDPLHEARKMSTNERAIFIENLSITIIPDEQSSEGNYFALGARDFFTGITLYLLNQNDDISFPTIIKEIVVGNAIDWVKKIKASSDLSAQSYTNHFYGENEKNVAGCYSKLVTATRLCSNEVMQELLDNSGNYITPNDLENCTDIYIQIDPNQIALYGPLIAMIYQSFMSTMLYRKAGQEPPIAFILDEFGQIPAMPVISQSAALMRAYNCSLMFSCQSLAMLEKHYGEAGRKLLMDCVKVNCFLSIMDPDTREWASRLIGTRKVLNVSSNEQISEKASSGQSVSETRERIFEPEFFGDLPNNDKTVISYMGKYIEAEKTYYFK